MVEPDAALEEETPLLDPLPSAVPLNPMDLLALTPSELTPSTLETSLAPLADSEVINLSIQLLSRHIEDYAVARTIVEIGLVRCAAEVARLSQSLAPASTITEESEIDQEEVKRLVGDDQARKEILAGYTVLEVVKRRLDTYEILAPPSKDRQTAAASAPTSAEDSTVKTTEESTDEQMELEDPWNEAEGVDQSSASSPLLDDPWETSSNPEPGPSAVSDAEAQPEPIVRLEPLETTESPASIISVSLTAFLNQPIPISALELAATASIISLKTICERHRDEVYLFRLTILNAIPGWASPSDLEPAGLLPALGENEKESWLPSQSHSSIPASPLFQTLTTLYLPPSYSLVSPSIPTQYYPLSSKDLTEWYTSQILSLDHVGILDIQLAWVQHGASLGVTGLDQVGEDLSLLSRLVYDANLSPTQHSQWTLSSWRESTETQIIEAYLSNATPDDIVADIRRLVLPYLYVLESRAERTGQADPNLVGRLLHEAILSLPLHLALPVFEASKATLPASARIVKNDLDVARLALACLYGSEEKESRIWSIMSSIFECLPVWELSGSDPESDAELTSTTLDSIAAFVRPTTASAAPPKPKDLFFFFHPLPFASLSRALDILDVHLESGEILARWNVPTQLRFLLQSARDTSDQTELAEKMVRRQSAKGKNLGEDGWRKLWDDLGRLSGGEESGLLRGALGMLDVQARAKIYLGGVLSNGNLDIARKMIKKLRLEGAVDDATIESVVLETSKEFYLAAESGNIHTGEMKLAYDCLAVAPPTPRISSEKAYIEATSRLTSFSTLSLTPLEIRHTSNPLSLISRVLESSEDAYKHPELIIDLSTKFGSVSESDKGLVQAMIGRAAERSGDYRRAQAAVEGCLEIVRKVQRRDRNKRQSDTGTYGHGHKRGQSSTSSLPQHGVDSGHEQSGEARLIDETWQLSFALAREKEYSDIPAKLTLLSYALELAPSKEIPGVLEVFRGLEDGRIKLDSAAKRRRLQGISAPHLPSISYVDEDELNLSGKAAEERVLGSRTAARAAKLALNIGGRFGVNVGAGVEGLRGLAHTRSPQLGGSPILDKLHFPLPLPNRSASRSPNPASGSASSFGAGAVANGLGLGRILSNDSTKRARPSSVASNRSEAAGAGDESHTPRELFDTLGNLGGSGAEEAERVRQGARRALVRGVGWLLGAEEGEIGAE